MAYLSSKIQYIFCEWCTIPPLTSLFLSFTSMILPQSHCQTAPIHCLQMTCISTILLGHQYIDHQHLQIDIDSLCDWTDLNNLQFNSSNANLWLWLFLEKATVLSHQPLTVNGTQLERDQCTFGKKVVELECWEKILYITPSCDCPFFEISVYS